MNSEEIQQRADANADKYERMIDESTVSPIDKHILRMLVAKSFETLLLLSKDGIKLGFNLLSEIGVDGAEISQENL